jgi:hypothetical protein
MSCYVQVQRLIDAGANVNEPSTGPKSPGGTPLHLAAAGGHIDVMDELLERGADIDVRTKGGCGCEYLPAQISCTKFSLFGNHQFVFLALLGLPI